MTVETKTYKLEGDLLEACSCDTLCPCWIGEDPDTGYCDAITSWHITSGQVKGVDVSGMTFLGVAKIPGNVFAGNWKVVVYMDDWATQEQRDALVEVFTGQLGGGIADMAKLIGEVLDVRTANIKYNIAQGHGTIEVEGVVFSDMQPYVGPHGEPTRLVDSVFSTIPGSPAYVSKASVSRVNLPEFGMSWEYNGKNAIQGHFVLEP